MKREAVQKLVYEEIANLDEHVANVQRKIEELESRFDKLVTVLDELGPQVLRSRLPMPIPF
jgi:ribose 1,5-bisphosphokinase PhnN